MCIAIGLASVDAGGINLNIDSAILRVLLVDVDGPAKLLKATTAPTHHHMANLKIYFRMGGINLPRHDSLSYCIYVLEVVCVKTLWPCSSFSTARSSSRSCFLS